MVLPVGTIATTCHPSRDCSVRRSASEPASYDDTLIEDNRVIENDQHGIESSSANGSGNVASLVVYWNYENSICGGVNNGSFSQFNIGAIHRVSYAPSDATLVPARCASHSLG